MTRFGFIKLFSPTACHPTSSPKKKIVDDKNKGRTITIALAGNANVGKSVIFNQLTGSDQIIGNWPGKTIERAEGSLLFKGYNISVIDLPGIYSLSTYSLEELVTREYIVTEKPDVIVNVIDASILERNLFFTTQLIELGVPLVLCINQVDIAKKKGIELDYEKIAEWLGVPVAPTIAISGMGIDKLMDAVLEVAKSSTKEKKHLLIYGPEIEKRIERLTRMIESKNISTSYPARWLAIKLLEDDAEIKKTIKNRSEEVFVATQVLSGEVQDIHKEPCYTVMASERYAFASKVTTDSLREERRGVTLTEKIDAITTHRLFGYVVAIGVCVGLLLWTFTIGTFVSGMFSDALEQIETLDPKVSGDYLAIAWNGAFGGFVAGVTLVIPFVIPFYFILALIEDSGYLTRLAFMLDTAMHKIGLHGKAVIPLMLGYGCNVPAIYSCRIMETRRQRMIASFVVTLAPCTARTVVILGLVALFVSMEWALLLYVIDVIIIMVLGRIAFKAIPGDSPGLIMEVHEYKMPSINVVMKQTWARTKSLIYIVFPVYIVGSILIQLFFALGVLDPINSAASIITEKWLGLPAVAGVLLIFGVVRKELTILTIATIFNTVDFATVLTPVQMIVLSLVSMVYIPCAATIMVLAKEFGWKPAIVITVSEIAFAIFLGGIMYRVLALVGI
jgi:ferrous iron transport protein B